MKRPYWQRAVLALLATCLQLQWVRLAISVRPGESADAVGGGRVALELAPSAKAAGGASGWLKVERGWAVGRFLGPYQLEAELHDRPALSLDRGKRFQSGTSSLLNLSDTRQQGEEQGLGLPDEQFQHPGIELEDQLGQGSFGRTYQATYEATHSTTKQRVAVKFIYLKGHDKMLATNADCKGKKCERALKELRAECLHLMRLRKGAETHPRPEWSKRVMSCLAECGFESSSGAEDDGCGGPQGGPPFVVLEWGGMSGRTWFEQVGFHDKAALASILEQIRQGIAYLSQLEPPVMHHDVNYDNICVKQVGESWEMVLIDFGAAMTWDEDHFKRGYHVGTNVYGPPEWQLYWMYRGPPWAFDVYSLGFMILLGLCFTDYDRVSKLAGLAIRNFEAPVGEYAPCADLGLAENSCCISAEQLLSPEPGRRPPPVEFGISVAGVSMDVNKTGLADDWGKQSMWRRLQAAFSEDSSPKSVQSRTSRMLSFEDFGLNEEEVHGSKYRDHWRNMMRNDGLQKLPGPLADAWGILERMSRESFIGNVASGDDWQVFVHLRRAMLDGSLKFHDQTHRKLCASTLHFASAPMFSSSPATLPAVSAALTLLRRVDLWRAAVRGRGSGDQAAAWRLRFPLRLLLGAPAVLPFSAVEQKFKLLQDASSELFAGASHILEKARRVAKVAQAKPSPAEGELILQRLTQSLAWKLQLVALQAHCGSQLSTAVSGLASRLYRSGHALTGQAAESLLGGPGQGDLELAVAALSRFQKAVRGVGALGILRSGPAVTVPDLGVPSFSKLQAELQLQRLGELSTIPSSPTSSDLPGLMSRHCHVASAAITTQASDYSELVGIVASLTGTLRASLAEVVQMDPSSSKRSARQYKFGASMLEDLGQAGLAEALLEELYTDADSGEKGSDAFPGNYDKWGNSRGFEEVISSRNNNEKFRSLMAGHKAKQVQPGLMRQVKQLTFALDRLDTIRTDCGPELPE